MIHLNFYISLLFIKEIWGHGMMLDPPNRSSLWRFDRTSPVNYDDDGNYCGGISTQWDLFGGKCGVCGDSYGDAHPQNNENTGKYGRGKIAATYKSGSFIDIHILLTANHKGYFTYGLCVLHNFNAPEPGENCFTPLHFLDGSTKYKIVGGVYNFTNTVKLPDGLSCERCVLRWQYTAGNNWGKCDDGTYANGCGPQETFRNCADVAIL